jgi:hypothetical protein
MEYNPRIASLQGQLEAVEQMLSSTSNILMRTSLENRVALLEQQIETAASSSIDVARFDVWFSGRGVYGSQGISAVFMRDTMQALMGMIQSSARDKVRRLREEHRKASMPRGQFYVTALTHGSFGYELAYKDEQGSLFDDPAIVDSIRGTMSVIETATKGHLEMEQLIHEQPIRMVSNLKDLFTTLKKQGSTLRMESGSRALMLDSTHVSQGYDNICLSDIIEKDEQVVAVFKGALIESGKFEYTDAEGHLVRGHMSEDLSGEQIAALNRRYSGEECCLQIVRRIVSYSSGRKKENVELTGITDDIREIQTSKS